MEVAMVTRVDEALRFLREWESLTSMGDGYVATWEREIHDGCDLARMALRHAVILEGANVDCRAVRDGGG